MTKEEYLHTLGTELLIKHSAGAGDTADTLRDYDALLSEDEDVAKTVARLGSPAKAARELDGGNSVARALHAGSAVLLLLGLIRWDALLFKGNWQPAGGDALIFISAAMVIILALFAAAGRIRAQALLLPLRRTQRAEKNLLWLLQLLPLLSVLLPLALGYRALENADAVSPEEMLGVGPRMTLTICVLCGICLVLAALSLWRVLTGRVWWSLIFAHSLAAQGALLFLRHTLKTLADARGAWVSLLGCLIPYAAGLALTLALALLIIRGAARGRTLWTRK